LSEKEKSRDIISRRAVATRLSPEILNLSEVLALKGLAKSLAYIAFGFVTAAINQSIGTVYAVAALIAGSALLFINESEAK
jgi:hypothetical protein